MNEDITLRSLHSEYEKRAFARDLLLQLPYCAIALCEESGEIAGKVKKFLRDDEGIISYERKIAIAQEIGDVLFYLDWLAHNVGFDLQDCYNLYTVKLDSRNARGTLHGSGDNR